MIGFNNQVQPLQDTVAALEQVSNLQLSQEMSSDEVLQRILDLNAEAYHNRKQQAEQQLTDALIINLKPEYTNVDGVGTGTTNTQQASTGVIAIGDSIANAFGNQYKRLVSLLTVKTVVILIKYLIPSRNLVRVNYKVKLSFYLLAYLIIPRLI